MPRYEAPTPIEVTIDHSAGYTEVIASDRGDVNVEVSPGNPQRSGDVALARETTVSFENGRLRIVVPHRLRLLRNPFRNADSVDLRIELPTRSRLVIESEYGSLRTRGSLGDSRITANYGNVTVDSVGGLALEAQYGTVDIAEVGGRLDATAGYGMLRVSELGGEARIRGAHGPIHLGTTDGNVDVSTAGPLTIDRAAGDVSARTAYGPLQVREIGGGSIQLENGYAEVEVGVPEGVAAWVDASSRHGAVRNKLTPSSDPGAATRTAELRLRATYGDILIRRSTGTSRKEAP